MAAAISSRPLVSTSWLQIVTVLKTAGVAGVFFDRYSAGDLKFALVDVAAGKVYLGHVSPTTGWVVDAVYSKVLSAATSYNLEVNLQGASASITINGEFMVSAGYNAGVLDGGFGLMVNTGSAAYDRVSVRSNDAALAGLSPPPSVPDVSVNNVSVAEGNSGTRTATVTVTLSQAASGTVTVPWTLRAGTASAGSDYAGASGTVTFASGQTTATFTVTIVGDAVLEADETFEVVLGAPTGANLARGSATVTITNDDLPTVSIGSASTTEGNTGTKSVTLTVTVGAGATAPVTVSVSRTGGTATSGTDFTAFSPVTLTFAVGETSKTVTVVVRGDTTRESDETVVFGLSAVSGATLGAATGTLTIVEDDSKLVAATVGPGTGQRLRPKAVRRTMRAALSWWRARGATARELAGIRVVMRSMSGTDLGQANGRTIALDVDAAGWGWSTGATAQEGRMHLFSVLVHEIGHVLGHDHADGGVMGAVLAAGQTLTDRSGTPQTSRR